jgi:hypothetical protein
MTTPGSDISPETPGQVGPQSKSPSNGTSPRPATKPRSSATRTRAGTPKKASPKRPVAKSTSTRRRTVKTRAKSQGSSTAKFPRHPVERALRIPKVILDQNAGQPATAAEAARFLGGKVSGEFNVEVSSAKKYGFLESDGGKLIVTKRSKQILRPEKDADIVNGLRDALLRAPDIADVYNHYRGEHLPDDQFFSNALSERFHIPVDKIGDFQDVFMTSMRSAKLIDESGIRPKLIDVGRDENPSEKEKSAGQGAKQSRGASLIDGTCFVMQPFQSPYDAYYETLFMPAIIKAGLSPVRADAEIFGSGKIMDQVWRGIREAKVLVAELTTRNANVYYELGLAHAQGKPVVLIAAEGEDVPFDVHHIRVIYYNINDPFWGEKLISKIADNLSSALSNPEEAVLEAKDFA